MAEISVGKAVLDDGVVGYTQALLEKLQTVDHSSFQLKEWQGLVALAWVCYVFIASQRESPLRMMHEEHLYKIVTALMEVADSLGDSRES